MLYFDNYTNVMKEPKGVSIWNMTLIFTRYEWCTSEGYIIKDLLFIVWVSSERCVNYYIFILIEPLSCKFFEVIILTNNVYKWILDKSKVRIFNYITLLNFHISFMFKIMFEFFKIIIIFGNLYNVSHWKFKVRFLKLAHFWHRCHDLHWLWIIGFIL